ncbi:GlxA family transcriptional regulator [Undibacterium sp. Tian12W]|uniref:GlxA family transcriptional regulator n=1 Tax=Undibacterium sp. Tian12W TaxID=3413054 RepID=UPI003BEFAE93
MKSIKATKSGVVKRSTLARTVDIVIYPGFKALEAIGPMSVFEYANIHLQRQGKPAAYDVKIAAAHLGSVRSDTLMCLEASKLINTLVLPDDVIIVGSRHIQQALADNQAIIDWVAEVATRIKRLAALCSGAFFLARTGLLDGKHATTHWSVAKQLQDDFAAVQVDADAIFIRSGNLWTSAGVTAGIDLALAFVEDDCGHELALEVASDMVVYLKRPGGQSQFSTHLMSQKTAQTNIRELQQWILSNLHQRLPVSQLAKMAGMSLRNFTRLFQHEVGVSTTEFIETARLEFARQLLADMSEQTLPVKTIAARCGFGSDDQLRRVFQKRLQMSPTQYRAELL